MSRARASGPLEGPLLQREITLLLAIYLAEDGSWVFYARRDGMRIGSCHPNWHQNTRAPGDGYRTIIAGCLESVPKINHKIILEMNVHTPYQRMVVHRD